MVRNVVLLANGLNIVTFSGFATRGVHSLEKSAGGDGGEEGVFVEGRDADSWQAL